MKNNIKNEYKSFLDDIEKNIKNKEDLEYIKKRFTSFLDVMLGQIDHIVDYKKEEIEKLEQAQKQIEERIMRRFGCAPEEAEILELYLSSLRGRRVHLTVPQRGEKKQLVHMLLKNINNAVDDYKISELKRETESGVLEKFAQYASLEKIPRRIESYDISNTGTTGIVGVMVVFENGVVNKAAKRHFRIQSVDGQNDYASMQEVLRRRMQRYLDGDEGFSPLPDLILLDGGKGQVNAVLPLLEKYNLDIPLFGMVKDSHHRTRAIACSGEELSLTSKRAAFTLVSTIQEEVHRFSIEYHRSRRKASVSTSLTAIDGVGENRAKALLKHFRTVKAISQASTEEIAAVKGMSKKTAQAVFDAFHPENGG